MDILKPKIGLLIQMFLLGKILLISAHTTEL